MPRRAAGGSHNLKTANLTLRRTSKPAFLAMSPARLATSFSPTTHRDTTNFLVEERVYILLAMHGGGNDDNYTDYKPTSFASLHSRERDSKGAPRRRWLEQSRSWKSSSGLCDRFTMEESLGIHQWTKRDHCFPLS